MKKKRWWIQDVGGGNFNLSRSGAIFYFNEMRESETDCSFYLRGYLIGTLYKSDNKIMNLEEFKKKHGSRW